MVKKLLGIAVALVVVASAASSTSATWNWWDMFDKGGEVYVNNTDMTVKTETEAEANTGDNYQKAYAKFGDAYQKMTTGDAAAAASAMVGVGITELPKCDCDFDKIVVRNYDFYVRTETEAEAETGDNTQRGYAKSWFGDVTQNMWTGNAGAVAGSNVTVGYTGFGVN